MKYYILYNGGKIYYSDKGSGSPVILLHGYLESSEVWSDFATKLSDFYRVISIDLPDMVFQPFCIVTLQNSWLMP
jgi:pimeloyl-ACP methyl ester carboxylesterase